MIGSTGTRMLSIALPIVDSWNMWYSHYGNTVEGFREQRARVDELAAAAGRQPGGVAATAAVLVRFPGGTGRLMGHYSVDSPPRCRLDGDIAAHLAALAEAGAAHVQLVLDPITTATIESVGEALAELRRIDQASRHRSVMLSAWRPTRISRPATGGTRRPATTSATTSRPEWPKGSSPSAPPAATESPTTIRTWRWPTSASASLFGNVAILRRPVDGGQWPAVAERMHRFFGGHDGAGFIVFSAWPTPDLRPTGSGGSVTRR